MFFDGTPCDVLFRLSKVSGFSHFLRSSNRGRYSRSQRFQNKSVMYWTCRQRRRAYVSSLRNTPCGRFGFVFSSSRWLGVRVSGLFASFCDRRLVTTTLISHSPERLQTILVKSALLEDSSQWHDRLRSNPIHPNWAHLPVPYIK